MATIAKTGIIPDFYLPTELYIRQDIISDLGNILRNYGSRVVMITTSRDLSQFQETVDVISRSISTANLGFIVFDEVEDSPNTEYVDSAAYFAKKSHCDIILGFGGIDSINVAKAVAVLTNNYLFCHDLFENPEIKPPVPLIIMPAYPVFGFETLPSLFVNELHTTVKRIYTHNSLYPKATIIDPVIATGIDDETTIYSSIAALSLATESVISKKTNDMINTYALKAIDLTFKNLPAAYKEPQNPALRTQLALASVMAGVAFSVAGLSIALSLSLALSSLPNISVSRSMAVLLPHIMEYNLTSSPGKYVQMSKVMDENIRDITVIEAAIKAVEGVRKLEIDVDIMQRLSQFDVPKTEFTRIAEIAMDYPYLDNAPRPLTRDEIETILIAAF